MNYAAHPGAKAGSKQLPLHVAIIMDGNGRWAASRQLSHTSGHRKGVEVARDVIFACQEKGIKVLTLFAFGVENWKRPRQEVRNLFRIFFLVLKRELRRLHEKNIRLRVIGDRSFFNDSLSQAVTEAEVMTQSNTGLCLNIAVNYSGRWDLLQAFKSTTEKILHDPLLLQQSYEKLISGSLSLAGMPEPDLFIRTSGEQRISNFILWELAYTELYFTSIMWPDFTVLDLEKALNEFASRERRFGLTHEQVTTIC
jgi:undecaprenyl diphosphate synthase